MRLESGQVRTATSLCLASFSLYFQQIIGAHSFIYRAKITFTYGFFGTGLLSTNRPLILSRANPKKGETVHI
jgi:hypothetical protein